MATKKVAPTALDEQGRITNVKTKKTKTTTPKAAKPTPGRVKTPGNEKVRPVKPPVVQRPQPTGQVDAYGRVTNAQAPVWNQPGGMQPGLMQRIQPVGTPITFQQTPWQQAPQQQDWMQPAGTYNGAPEYKPAKLTNVKTQYKTPKW